MKTKNLKRAAFLLGAFLFVAAGANAQEAKPTAPTPTAPQPQTSPQPQATPNPFAGIPAAKPEDVATLDAVIKSLYDVISGEAGVKRDWNRFRSLFYPGARMIPSGVNPRTRVGAARVITPEEYIERSAPLLEKDGFFEREIARRVETFGTITHVFSSYDSKHKQRDEKPFARGVNSIQLLNDGKRWWILTVAWSGETPENPLPDKYLKSGN